MTSIPPTTIDEAESAWLAAVATSVDAMRDLLHPDFVAVHSPIGRIQPAEEFLRDAADRPLAGDIRVLESTVRVFPDTVIVSGIQQSSLAYVPDVPPFTIQAAVTRVWVRVDGGWLLAHLQMARRFPPG